MNLVTTKCLKCGSNVLASSDEIIFFGGSVCVDCDTRLCRYIRHKAMYGYYDLPKVLNDIVEKILYKELVEPIIVDSDFAKDIKLENKILKKGNQDE